MIAVGCAHSQSPVLYPNAKLKEAGKAQADAEISACRSLADDYVSSGGATAKEIGKDTAAGGVGGAAVGAVAGAVSGGGAGRGGRPPPRPARRPRGRPPGPTNKRAPLHPPRTA